MNEIQRYILEEHVEDFEDGLISRRELLRRVTMITGSMAAALTVLAALGCNIDQPRVAPSPAPATVAPPATSLTAVSYATPPPGPTTDGVTVRPDDPRIVAGKADVKAVDGTLLIGYLARPKAAGTYPGILVVHENRGVLEHLRDVVRRVATAGFAGIAVDLLSRQGGADKLGDSYSAELGRRSVDDMVTDLVAALEHLRTQPFVDGELGITGFCFGGGMVWSVLNAGAPVKAAVPFYGPTPSKNDGIARTKAAVLAVYAGEDSRVNAGWPTIEGQLKKAGVTYRMNVYAGADHAFHNDTGARYKPDQARSAWVDAIEWFKSHLA